MSRPNNAHPSWANAAGRKPPKLAESSADTLEDQLKTIISQTVGCDESEIRDATSLRDDLGMDSLDLTELFMRIEEDYGLALAEDYDFDRLRTFGDILLLVVNLPAEVSTAGGEGNDRPSGSSRAGGAL
jgi:acyl carrier protein